MKKLILAMLFIFLCIPAASAKNTLSLPVIMVTTGTITSIMPNGYILLEGTGSYKKIVLTNIDTSYIIDGDTGEIISADLLKQGAQITAYYPPRMTRSLPPQVTPAAIITGDPAVSAKYFKIGQVDSVDNGVKILNSSRSQFVTVTKDVLPYPEQLKSQKEVLVWYKISTLSMPGQATAEKAKTIFHERPDIYAHISAGVAAVGGREVHTHYRGRNTETLYFPVKAVADAKDWIYIYNADRNEVVLHNAGKRVSFTLGSYDYTANNQTHTLKYPIYMIYGQVVAPMEFFMEALNMSVVAYDGHI